MGVYGTVFIIFYKTKAFVNEKLIEKKSQAWEMEERLRD